MSSLDDIYARTEFIDDEIVDGNSNVSLSSEEEVEPPPRRTNRGDPNVQHCRLSYSSKRVEFLPVNPNMVVQHSFDVNNAAAAGSLDHLGAAGGAPPPLSHAMGQSPQGNHPGAAGGAPPPSGSSGQPPPGFQNVGGLK